MKSICQYKDLRLIDEDEIVINTSHVVMYFKLITTLFILGTVAYMVMS